jgi:hypothetical protein
MHLHSDTFPRDRDEIPNLPQRRHLKREKHRYLARPRNDIGDLVRNLMEPFEKVTVLLVYAREGRAVFTVWDGMSGSIETSREA